MCENGNPYCTTKLGALYCGDSLDLIPRVAEGIDTVVADPPYVMGCMSTGKGPLWADVENAARFYAQWLGQCMERGKPDLLVWTFGSWRSIPSLLRAHDLAKLPAVSCMIWDKLWVGTGNIRGLRCRYEVATLGIRGDRGIGDRKAADIQACKWMAAHSGKTGHPAEKPVELIRRMLELSARPDSVVLDPFSGSGTTAVACERLGLRWVAIEREERFCETAARRLLDVAQAVPEEGVQDDEQQVVPHH